MRWLGVSIALCAAAVPAYAQEVRLFHLSGGDLTSLLHEFARQADIELLFDPALTAHRTARPLAVKLPVAEALRRVLSGTGLGFREAGNASYVIYLASPAQPAANEELAIPAILVMGRRTQDVDIRRTEDDIQPYGVQTAHDIETSHADTVDDFLRTRLSSNAEILSPTQNPGGQSASTRSEIDLHGLGASQTLVLVDGRRMPSLPSGEGLLQPDLNGIPLSAIDRIETLTGAAGGIYGPGATGGVVNVILKRDYRGADLNLTFGETQRGDAPRAQVDGRIGFTPDEGKTDVTLSFSRVVTGSLRVGDRSYEEQAQIQENTHAPAAYIGSFPLINGLLIGSQGGSLTLKPAYGGTALGSTFTFLPLGFRGSTSDEVALFRANAGNLPAQLAPYTANSPESLESNPSVTSILLNIRHHFADAIEGYVDVIGLRNTGRDDITKAASTELLASSPTSPFAQDVFLGLPLPGIGTSTVTQTDMTRVSGGLILKLPAGWRADLDYSRGTAGQRMTRMGSTVSDDFDTALGSGTPGANGQPVLDPLGNWHDFVAAVQAYRIPLKEYTALTNHMTDTSVRLAGPLYVLPAGPVALSLLVEDRVEEVPASTTTSTNLNFEGELVTQNPRLKQQVTSGYGELRVPLVPASSSLWPLRSLEAQLGIRYDRNVTTLPSNFDSVDVNSAFVTARQGAVVYTAGIKARPIGGLLLRASVATGILPPSESQLASVTDLIYGTGVGDPKRGNREVGTETPVAVMAGGSLSLQPERSRSVSIGAVVESLGPSGPRVSLDYTQIMKSDEISSAHGSDIAYFIQNEAAYPGRVVRAPLTPGDAALGFTGGVVTVVDTTNMNIGSTEVRTLDLTLSHEFRLGAGELRWRAAGTWEPTFKRRDSPEDPWVSFVDYFDGPLRWRGNGGLEWANSRLSLGANLLYYGRYRVASSAMNQFDLNNIVFQGSAWIPAQTYVDLFATYRLHLSENRLLPHSIELRFGVEDVFDKAPPIVAGYEFYQGYSSYGDPRRRRFELTLASHF